MKANSQNLRETAVPLACMAGIRSKIRALAGAGNGSVAIEFAVILPILLVLLIGLIEFRSGFLVKQRTIVAATTMSNIIADANLLTPQLVARLEHIAADILYPQEPAEIDVSVAVVTYNGFAIVIEWQENTGSEPIPQEMAEEMMAGLLLTTERAIISRVRVKHQPLISGLPEGLLTFESRNVTYPDSGLSFGSGSSPTESIR